MNTKSQFIIAAPGSNAGKTTVTLGLLRLLKQKNIAVQPYKVGPDFIDPKFHEQACGATGINLDLFMMREEHLQEQLGGSHEVSCIEGVMGLFDGARKAERSTAELATKLDIPVILVVDAKAVAYSVAPLIQGFKHFDNDLNLAGVIFNRVGSESHYAFLEEACQDIGVRSFGYLKRLEGAQIPSRHLGLNFDHMAQFNETIDRIAMALEDTVDWQGLLKETAFDFENKTAASLVQNESGQIRFAVAKDEAFSFIYSQHISAMKALGSVTFFSPIHDARLPDCDFLYLPGGYPENHLEALSANNSMREDIGNYISEGGKTFAECGGMMYLGDSIAGKEGRSFEMVKAFHFATSMEHPRMHLGYRQTKLDDLELKGHEFHYSTLAAQNETPAKAIVTNAREMAVTTDIFVKQQTMASYIHHYFGEKELLLKLVKQLEAL